MIKKNIHIVSVEPQTKRFYERYCIDDLIHYGYNVIFLDLSKLFNRYNPLAGKENKSIYIDSYENFELYFNYNNSKEDFVFWYLGGVNKSTIIFYNFFIKNNIKLFYFDDGRLPFGFLSFNFFISRIFERFIHLFFKLKSILLNRVIAKFNLVFYSGKMSKYFVKSNFNAKFYRPFNNTDYNKFLTVKDNGINTDQYILFLDQNIPDHPDILNLNICFNRDNYYKELNLFFDFVEKKTKNKIVVALHPTSDLKNHNFNNRKVVNDIVSNINNCHSFITFYSTALNYAIITHKPLLLLTSNEVSKHCKLGTKQAFFTSKFINQKIISISKNYHNEVLFKDVNKTKYNNYKQNFIVSSEGKHNSELILNGLNEL
tara:strand:- start:1069 stop:2184 length:1116 start_codon:yes stop_codon:yes gene_type:complete